MGGTFSLQGIELPPLFTFSKDLNCNWLRHPRSLFLALFILTFILTSYGKRGQTNQITVLDRLLH